MAKQARPPQHAGLLDKQLSIPASLYDHLFDTTDSADHITLPNKTVLIPMPHITPPESASTVYLSPKGLLVNECGLTAVTWKKHRRGAPLPKLKPLPASVRGATRTKSIGCVQLGKATDVATRTVTIRTLQSTYSRKRRRYIETPSA